MSSVTQSMKARAWGAARPKGRFAARTLLLGMATVAVWALVAVGVTKWHMGYWLSVPLLTIASYGSFTVMHEAVHRSLGTSPLLNTVIGTVASIGMGPTSSFTAYRLLHLEHHRHTNDPAMDPDVYSGVGPAWWLPLSWLTTDLYYYWFYLRSLGRRSMSDQIQIVIENIALLGAAAAMVWYGHGVEMLMYWFLPGRITTGLLAYAFNYLPHRPHDVRADVDEVGATRVYGADSWLVALLSAGHNLHQVHHLFPGIPFYDYARVWRALGAELNAHDTRQPKNQGHLYEY